MTKEMLIANLRKDQALKMLSGTISNYTLLDKNDIQRLAAIQTEQREIYLASVKLDEYKKGLTASSQEIADYYNKHKSSFKQNASVDVDYVVLTPAMMNTSTAYQQMLKFSRHIANM
jgi:peptidyl-prolyl cis-trans isomerase D